MTGAVVVTGASSGIGRAAALDLSRRGFRVFAGVRSEEDAEALRRAGTDPVMLDVTDAEAIAALRETVERELGADRLAGIVNPTSSAACTRATSSGWAGSSSSPSAPGRGPSGWRRRSPTR